MSSRDHDAPATPRSHLFTVRVWREELAENRWEWRGKVQRVDNGEAFYFRRWSDLIAHLEQWLQQR